MNFKSLFLVSGVILITSLFAYYYLGGFNKIKYEVRPGTTYKIIGREYTGKNNTLLLESIFEDAREKIENSYPEGVLIIVNDNSQYDDEFNRVGYFVGIMLDQFPDSIPEGYSSKEYDAEKVIRARIESHNFVMPKPDKIRIMAGEVAEADGFVLSEITIEKYLNEGVIEVDFLSVP